MAEEACAQGEDGRDNNVRDTLGLHTESLTSPHPSLGHSTACARHDSASHPMSFEVNLEALLCKLLWLNYRTMIVHKGPALSLNERQILLKFLTCVFLRACLPFLALFFSHRHLPKKGRCHVVSGGRVQVTAGQRKKRTDDQVAKVVAFGIRYCIM
jgi:hypothetical protein